MAADMILEVKKSVAREIGAKMNDRVAPELIREFLNGPWTEVMKIIGLRDGCEGKGWNTALKLVDDLLWSVQPKIVVKQRQELLALIPQILQTLQNGLTLIYYGQQEIDLFFQKLEKIHISCMSIGCAVKAATGTKHPRANALEDKILQEIVRQSTKHEAFQVDIVDPELQRSRYFETVRSLPLGRWVEFKHYNTSKRGRLVWKCDFSGEFTFLDRRFKVIAEVNLRDLIRQFEYGKARIVNQVPFIDRAVDAVVNGMNQYVGRGNRLVQVMN